jgi:hypothetical protein
MEPFKQWRKIGCKSEIRAYYKAGLKQPFKHENQKENNNENQCKDETPTVMNFVHGVVFTITPN